MHYGSTAARWMDVRTMDVRAIVMRSMVVRSMAVLVFLSWVMPVRAAAEPSPTAPVPAAAPAADRIFVLSLKANGALENLARNLSEIALRSIRAAVPASTVFGQTELDSMLAFEKQKDLLGCEANVSCLAELGGALGADALVLGSLGRVGSVFILSMKLIDTNRAEVLCHLSEEVVNDEDTLLEATRQISSALFAVDKTVGRGYLDVLGEGVVFVDDRNVGRAPLKGLPVESGIHSVEVRQAADGTAVVQKRVFVNRFATVRIEPEMLSAAAPTPPAVSEVQDKDEPTTQNGWFMQTKAGMSVIVQNTVNEEKRSITAPTLLDAQTLGGYAWQHGLYVFGAFSVSQLSKLLERDDSENSFGGKYDHVTVPPYLLGVGGGVGYGSSGKVRLGVSLTVQRCFLLADVYGLADVTEAAIEEDPNNARERLGSRGDGYWNIRPAVDLGVAMTEHLYLGLSVSSPMFVGNGNTLYNIGVAGVAGFAVPPALAEGESSLTDSWEFWTATGLVALGSAAAVWQAVAAP